MINTHHTEDAAENEMNESQTTMTVPAANVPLRSGSAAQRAVFPQVKRDEGCSFLFCNSRVSSISFNVICIITDIIGFIIMSTDHGKYINKVISDRTSDIVLSLFLLCSLSGIIGAIFYESAWLVIPRFAYILKAILAALTGLFVVNVVPPSGLEFYRTVILSIFAVLLYAAASHAQALFILEINAGIMNPDYMF